MKCIVRIVMLICLTIGLFASPLCVFAEDSKTSTANESQGTTTSAVIPYDNSVLTRTTDNIKDNFTSNSISGYSFNDMIPLVDGWVIIGDIVKKEVLIVNAISGEVAKEYKLDAAPDRIDLNPEKGKIIASQASANQIALIDACNDEVKYISTSGPAVDVTFVKGNYAAAIISNLKDNRKISVVDWTSSVEVASIDDDDENYDCIACDRDTNNILAGETCRMPSSLSRFFFNEDKKMLEKKEYLRDAGWHGGSLSISPDGLHTAFIFTHGSRYGYAFFDRNPININNLIGEWNFGDCPVDSYCSSAVFSRDSKYLIATNGLSLKLFDVETHALIKTISDEGNFRIAGISNGGKIAFAKSEDGKLSSYLISISDSNSINCANPVFDPSNPQDIVVNMNSNTLRTVKNGTASLASVDYSISGSTVTIKKNYLTYFFNKFNLPGQKLNLMFDFENGNDPILTITSIPASNLITCKNPVFDLSNPQDIAVNVTGAALKLVKNGTASLASSDYSISGNTVIIKKSYLVYFFSKFTLAQSVYLTFDFESGNDPVFTIANSIRSTTSSSITYDSSVLTRTTDNIKDSNFKSNSISGYSFSDMVPLVDGWVIIGDIVKNKVIIVNAISGEVAKEYQLKSAPDRIDFNPERRKIIASQTSSNNIALIDVCTDEIKYISISGVAIDVAFAKDNYAAAIISTGTAWYDRKISMIDWASGLESASIGNQNEDYGYLVCDRVKNNIIVATFNTSPSSLSRFEFNSDKKELDRKEYVSFYDSNGKSLSISPDGLHLALIGSDGYVIYDMNPTNIEYCTDVWDTDSNHISAMFSGDSKYLISTNGFSIQLFGVETHTLIDTLATKGNFGVVGISNGGKIAFASSKDGRLLSYLISISSNSITCDNPVFDLSNPQDIKVNIAGAKLNGIKNGVAPLKGVDYSVSGNTVTINKDYLSYYFKKICLPNQKLNLIFDFNGGTDNVFTISLAQVDNLAVCYNSVFDTLNPQDITVNISGGKLMAIKNGSASLTASDYSVSGNIVTIKKSYLSYFFNKFTEPWQKLNLIFNFESGNDSLITINRMLITNTVESNNSAFDLTNPQDITINMKGTALTSIKNGSASLSSSDYSISGNTITIKKSYLTYFFTKFTDPWQKLNLTFDFISGNDPLFTISNMQIINYISCGSPVFDMSNPQDITVKIVGNSLSAIKNGSVLLHGGDYSVSGNIVTIKKSYLLNLFNSNQNMNLTFDFEKGNDPALIISKISNANLISCLSPVFDVEFPQDIKVKMSGAALSALKNGFSPLTSSDYSISKDIITVKKGYLTYFFNKFNKPDQKLNLTFDFVSGNGQTLTISKNTNPVYFNAVAAGDYHSVAIKEDGTVVAWGGNYSGQCDVPFGLGKVKAVVAGTAFTVAVKEDGTVVAWGDNTYGQCNVPVGLKNVKTVSAKYHHIVALKEDGTVIAWGDNQYGECYIPAGLAGVKAVAAGYQNTLVLKEDGSIIGWGYMSATGLDKVKAIASGGGYNLELKEDGTVVEQKSNGYCDLTIKNLKGIKAVDAGWQYAIALGENGTVSLMPDYIDPSYEGLLQITQVAGVKAVSAGYKHILALKEDGTIIACGNNVCGQCTIPYQKAK